MSWEAKHCWENWTDHLGVLDTPAVACLHRTGVALLDVDAVPKPSMLALLDEAGVPYEEWDPATLATQVPSIDTGRFGPPKRLDDDAFWAQADGRLGAVFTPDAGFVDDPMLAAVNLADAARRRGVEFLFHREVVAVRHRGGRVAGLDLADGGRIDCPIVVNVAGPWSSMLNTLAGVGDDFTIAVRPMRQEVHHVSAPPGYNNGAVFGPCVADLDLGVYVRATPGDGMLIGGTEPDCDPLQWLDDPNQANPNPTPHMFETQVVRAARRFPGLAVPSRPRGIAGVYDVAEDWTPIYDRTALDGFYVAMGTSGNQFKNAPIVGRVMAEIIGAVEAGRDHDADPVCLVGAHTGLEIDLGAFSRKRGRNENSSMSVMG